VVAIDAPLIITKVHSRRARVTSTYLLQRNPRVGVRLKLGRLEMAAKKSGKKTKGKRGRRKVRVDSIWWLERRHASHLGELGAALEAASVEAVATKSCPVRVIETVHQWGGGTVTSGGDTLQQLSINQPCSVGRVEDLREMLSSFCNADFPMSCATTVGFIILHCCSID
jgi:hypothetical protein